MAGWEVVTPSVQCAIAHSGPPPFHLGAKFQKCTLLRATLEKHPGASAETAAFLLGVSSWAYNISVMHVILATSPFLGKILSCWVSPLKF